MSTENYLLADDVHAYLRRISPREPDVLRALREETAELPGKNLQAPPELGQLLAFLVELSGARTVLELGTYTGYSALAMALAMAPGGRVVACDGNKPAHEVARRYWARAGVADTIELRVGECADSLAELVAENRHESFDLAFIDADKPGYAQYLESCLVLLRPGGLMVFDNILMGGDAIRDRPRGKYTAEMRAFNEALRDDTRVAIVPLALGDGITLARKRPPAVNDLFTRL